MKCKNCESAGDFIPEAGDYLCFEHMRSFFFERHHPERGYTALLDFCKDLFPRLFKPQYGHCSFHEEMCKNYHYGFTKSTDKLDGLFGHFGHRELAKSTYATALALYGNVYGIKKFVMYRGDTFSNAKKNFIANLKSMLAEPRFEAVHGDLRPSNFDTGLKDTEAVVMLRNGGLFVAMGYNQSSRSARYDDRRIDLFVWDDVENDENTKSETSIQNLITKLNAEDIPALDFERGMLVVNNTPVAKEAVFDSVMNDESFKVVYRPLYKVNKNGEYILDANGNQQPEWPQRYSLEWCKKLEARYNKTPHLRKLFAREYLLKFVSEDDESIPRDQIRFAKAQFKNERGKNWIFVTEKDGVTVAQPEWKRIHIAFGADPATSEEGGACDSVINVVARSSDDEIFVLESYADKLRSRDVLVSDRGYGMYDICTDIKNIAKKGIVSEICRRFIDYMPDMVAVESVVEYVNNYREIMNSYHNWWLRRSKWHIKFAAENPSKGSGKRDRIRSELSGMFDRKRVFILGEVYEERDESGRLIKRKVPMEELVDQLVNLSTTKKIDRADALAIAFKYSEIPDNEYLEAVEDYWTPRQRQEDKVDLITKQHRNILNGRYIRSQ